MENLSIISQIPARDPRVAAEAHCRSLQRAKSELGSPSPSPPPPRPPLPAMRSRLQRWLRAKSIVRLVLLLITAAVLFLLTYLHMMFGLKKSLHKHLPAMASAGNDTAAMASRFFAIHVVDQDTNRGIPLVFMRTNYKSIQMTDSAGYIAFYEPGLMTGEPIWVVFSSYGYEAPKDVNNHMLSLDGQYIRPRSGEEITVRLKRSQIAERLYRITGYGIYRDSMLLGKQVPIEKPLLNNRVTGSDTVQCAKFQGKLLWMWQDTDDMREGLGNFNMTAAYTDSPAHLDPDQGLNYKYLTKNGSPNEFVRKMVDFSVLCGQQPCPIWVDGLTVVLDGQQRERLVGRYVASDHLKCVEEGLVLWDDTDRILSRLVKFPECGTLSPAGHTIYVQDRGVRYAYYGNNTRVRATFDSASDPTQYEAFTCLTLDGQQANRNSKGELIWNWVKGGKPVNHDTMNKSIEAGIIRPDESPYQLTDVNTGKPVFAAQVAIAWNPYLKLWINIIQQKWGDSFLGETWYSTARSPEGPWVACVKLNTHAMDRDGYNNNTNDFYNPVQHYELMREGGRIVYYTGTYVNTFSGNAMWTPYYNYNNIMYRLNLDDPRLGLPEPPPPLWSTQPDFN